MPESEFVQLVRNGSRPKEHLGAPLPKKSSYFSMPGPNTRYLYKCLTTIAKGIVKCNLAL